MVESTGDVALNGAIIRRKPASFSVLSGRDVMVLPLMALGIDGAISTVANAFPVECARMMDQMAFGISTMHGKRIIYWLRYCAFWKPRELLPG